MKQNQDGRQWHKTTLILCLFSVLILVTSCSMQVSKKDILECRETYKNSTGSSFTAKEKLQNYSYIYPLKSKESFRDAYEKHQFTCRVRRDLKPINRHYTSWNQQIFWLKSDTSSYSECTSFLPCQGAGPHRTRIILTHRYTLLPAAVDVQKFTPLSDQLPFATDGTAVYFENKVVKNIVLPETLTDAKVQTVDKRGDYVIFGVNVLYEGKSLENADGNTFEILSNDFTHDDFSRDKNQVYFRGKVLPDADPRSFEVINRGLAQDHTRVWAIQIGDDLPILKPHYKANIKKLKGSYAKNKTQVFISSSLIKEADANSFEVVDLACKKESSPCGIKKDLLCPVPNAPSLRCGVDQYAYAATDYKFGWGKDKNHVYEGGYIHKTADAKSFQLILLSFSSSYYAIDKKNIYNLKWSRYTFATTGTVSGPIYRNDDHTYRPIFADEKGFFTVDKERIHLCAYDTERSKTTPESRGKLRVMKAPDAAIVWAFEDNDFQYFFKNAATYYESPKSEQERLDKMDYIIDKKSKIKYPMFWPGTGCTAIN